MSVDYGTIKRNIVKSAVQNSKGVLSFFIKYSKLNNDISDLDLVLIPNGLQSRQIESFDIPLISEYFKNEKLNWFNRSRQFTVLTFVPKNAVDDRLKDMIEKLKSSDTVKDPDFDPVDIMADIEADYPCYNATVVGYQTNNPDYIGKNNYSIVIRANIRVITSPEYSYNNTDI